MVILTWPRPSLFCTHLVHTHVPSRLLSKGAMRRAFPTVVFNRPAWSSLVEERRRCCMHAKPVMIFFSDSRVFMSALIRSSFVSSERA